jgi:hypothetical protein
MWISSCTAPAAWLFQNPSGGLRPADEIRRGATICLQSELDTELEQEDADTEIARASDKARMLID